MTVAGCTRTSADRHSLQIRENDTPGQPVSRGETEARSARALQDLQLMSEGENLELQRRPRA